MNTTPPTLNRGITLAENSTYLNGILYVPIGSVEEYKNDKNWGKFFNIQEIANDEPSANRRCEKPTISYNMGKIIFYCATEGSICHSTITDSDISSYTANEVQLEVTYNISVYATKPGYDNSETTTATLCWIDVEPKTEGIDNSITNVRAKAVLIQSNCGILDISGADAGTTINVYDTGGRLVGSAKASVVGTTTISTKLQNGDVGIVKIGNKSVKIRMK